MHTDLRKITDPRELARAALAERCRSNPQYSLRAFARATGISHTVLSLVLSGKRKFSQRAVKQLADFLALDPAHSRKLLGEGGRAPTDYEDLSLDTFQMISDWYHYAILSALELPNARFEAAWLAKNLSLSLTQAKLAMDRLERLGMVEKQGRRYRQTGKPLQVANNESTAATRNFHRQLLDKAKESIEKTSFRSRDLSSTTFVMDAAHVPYAKKRIREFRRQLAAELEALGPSKAVYNLTVQLFPVTPVEDEKELP